jgi:serine/threonine protein kinase
MNVSKCPPRDALADFALGNLPETEIEWVTDHLEACTDCEATVAGLEDEADTFVAALRSPMRTSGYAEEPEFGEAVQAIQLIGREPLATSKTSPRSAEPIGRLRDYDLLAKLGAGGMATVYKARHRKMQRVVALKLLPAHRGSDAASVSRFAREIEAVGTLSHPNIVRAHDAGEDQGMHYLVMEMVDGVDLHRLVKQVGALEVADACEVVRQAALGMQHAHENELVHRDIKPSNLLLSRDGQVKILDLGLALWQSDAMRQENLTTSGTVMGTLDYMAPEQADDSHRVDIRADIYSLGCTLYKLLNGQAPFALPTCDTPVKKIMAHARQTPTAVSQTRHDVPTLLGQLLDRMLAKDPADRPQTPGEVATLLGAFASGSNLIGLAERASAAASSDEVVAAANEIPVMLNRGPTAKPAKGVSARSRNVPRGWLLLATAGFLLLIAAAVVFVFRTPYGELSIEAEGNVKIEVTGQSNVIAIVDTDTGKSIRLRAGEYGIRLVDDSVPFVLNTNRVVMRRGRQVVVTARFKPKEEAKQSPAPLRSLPQVANAENRRPNSSWSKVISPTTIEDQIKAVRQDLYQQLQGQPDLQGVRRREVHSDLNQLAMLFGIVNEYDEAIRWKRQASTMRFRLARAARLSKVGGKAVYQMAQQSLHELDLVLAGDLKEPALESDEFIWSDVCERVPLMQWMNTVYMDEFESHVSKQDDFRDNRDRVRRHAELVAGIATVLLQEGMESSDDDDYRDLAKSLLQHARKLKQAAEENEYETSRLQVTLISHTCSNCHELYR